MNRLIIAGVFFVIIGIPFYLGKVAPNRWSGFRVPKTFSSPETWYAANKTMGFDLIIAGAVMLVTALILAIVSQKHPGVPLERISYGVFLTALVVAAVHSFWALSRL